MANNQTSNKTLDRLNQQQSLVHVYSQPGKWRTLSKEAYSRVALRTESRHLGGWLCSNKKMERVLGFKEECDRLEYAYG